MYEQPNSPRPVTPLREPPRLDAFGDPLPEDWHLTRPPRLTRPRSVNELTLQQTLQPAMDQALLMLRALVSSEAQDKLLGNGPVEEIYSVPRRFDISTLFVVSMAFAFLFALLGYCGISSLGKLTFCFYISGVGFAQAALFGSRAPRLSSIVAGGLLLLLIALAFGWSEGGLFMVGVAPFAFVFGLPAGYLIGTICGGVFLVADKVRTRYGW